MRYMDSHCGTQVHIDENHVVYFVHTGHCVLCHKDVTVKVKALEQLDLRRGMLIDQALISNTSAEQEFLYSGICKECFE